MKIQSIALNSINVRYNNHNDESRKYDIESNVNIQGKQANGFESGVVKRDGLQIATFSMWGINLNQSFQNLTPSEMCEVLIAINEFIEAVKNNAMTNSINI